MSLHALWSPKAKALPIRPMANMILHRRVFSQNDSDAYKHPRVRSSKLACFPHDLTQAGCLDVEQIETSSCSAKSHLSS
jgi:hypothetical protein